MKNKSNLFVIGTGSFSGMDLTLRAIKALKLSKVIFAPKSSNLTYALKSIKEVIPEEDLGELVPLAIEMGKMDEEKYRELAQLINERIKGEVNASILTIGDPSIYSSFYHIKKHLSKDINIKLIPGISSPFSAAALLNIPLLENGESLLICDKYPKEEVLDSCESLAILKNGKGEGKEAFLKVLDKKSFSYFLVKRIGGQGEEIIKDREKILVDNDYMGILLCFKREMEDGIS